MEILTKDAGRSGLCLLLSRSAKSRAEKSASGLAAGCVPNIGESVLNVPESPSHSVDTSNSGIVKKYFL